MLSLPCTCRVAYTRITALPCLKSSIARSQRHGHSYIKNSYWLHYDCRSLCDLYKQEKLLGKDQVKKACFPCFFNFTFSDKLHQQHAFAWIGREGPFVLIRTNIAIREIVGLSYLSHSSLVFLGQKKLHSINL